MTISLRQVLGASAIVLIVLSVLVGIPYAVPVAVVLVAIGLLV